MRGSNEGKAQHISFNGEPQRDIDEEIELILADQTPVTDADRPAILEFQLAISKGENALLAKALKQALDALQTVQGAIFEDPYFSDVQSVVEAAIDQAEAFLYD